ncbi:MAG: hypothetical protein GF308_01320 [Candidatus Heimdallarchaeota archaeon]|nr:hypothetical protein [Candidatus Heimdallarchaeota archaeon]
MKHLKFNSNDPFKEIRKNPSRINEFYKEIIDFEIELIEENNKKQYLILQQSFEDMTVKYLFISFQQKTLNWEKFDEIITDYTAFVKDKGEYNYRKTKLIIIAKDYSREVLEYINSYNEIYEKRKAIAVFKLDN